MMHKIFTALIIVTALQAEQMYLYEISPVIGLSENGSALNTERSMMYGLQFQYNDIDFPIKPELSYFIAPKVTFLESDEKATGQLILLNGVYDLEYTALLTPFVKVGMGYQSLSNTPCTVDSNNFVLGTGAGLKLHIADKVSVKFETSMTLQDFQNSNILVFAGLNIAFGNEDNLPSAEHLTAPVTQDHNISTALETNSTASPQKKIVIEGPVYISKSDYNLTETTPSKQEVVVRDADNKIASITLFVPYLFRSYSLDDTSKDILKQYAVKLQKENSKITIIGHTDTKGRRSFNKELSLKRANAVKELFVEYGVAPERIHVEGHGESEPIAEKSNPTASYLNKRIEIKISH